MGEFAVGHNGELLRTLLGSCVGLALYDRRAKVGGLAHIVLPESKGRTERPGKFIDTAIPALIDAMKKHNANPSKLTAKIAGGASMFSHSIAADIGRKNVDACREQLKQLNIPLIANHCGGTQGRKMSFNTGNGVINIEIVGQPEVTL